MSKLTRVTLATASGLAVLLSGCAPSTSSPSGSTAPPTSSAPSASPTTSTAGDPAARKAAALGAIKTAEAAVNGTAFSLDWTSDRWELELIANGRMHDIYVSSDGTTIVRQSSDRADAEDVLLLGRAKVTMAEAVSKALETSPEATVVEADLDSRAGQPVWELDTITGTQRQRVRVDAVTGQII